MKSISTLLLALGLFVLGGCTTPVAIDPATGQDQTAEFKAGFFYGPLNAPIDEAFRVAIREIDDMGYFRTGELHRETSITIYARKVGDEKVTVRAFVPADTEGLSAGQNMLRIRVGMLGNLPESQAIYARIRDAL